MHGAATSAGNPTGWLEGAFTRIERVLIAVAGAAILVSGGITVRGTFNPAGIAGLASGNEAAERTARATEQTARNTRRLADMATTNGLTFG